MRAFQRAGVVELGAPAPRKARGVNRWPCPELRVAASGFGKGGLFTDSGDNTKGSGDSKVSEAAVPQAKAKNSDTPVSTTKTTAGTPALAASNLTKEKKRRSKDSEEKEEDYDDSSFWLLTAGAALLVAGIAVFTLMRSK